MPRPLRIEYPGACYHVIDRGWGRRHIFKTDEQRRYFLQLLADTAEQFQAEWHAYCLMDRQYHLMLRTPEGNLQRIMRHINGLYTQFFNRRDRRAGALFRGRYKSVLIDAETYWLKLSRYIHRYPLDTRVVARLEDHRWSSYPCYIGAEKAPPWLATGHIQNSLGKRNRHARYRDFAAGEPDRALRIFYNAGRLRAVLGDDLFRRQISEGAQPSLGPAELNAAKPRPDWQTIVEQVCRRYAVEEELIWRSKRGRAATSPARSVAMYLCHKLADMRLSEIAQLFGLASFASAGASIRRVRMRIPLDKQLAKDINSLVRKLAP